MEPSDRKNSNNYLPLLLPSQLSLTRLLTPLSPTLSRLVPILLTDRLRNRRMVSDYRSTIPINVVGCIVMFVSPRLFNSCTNSLMLLLRNWIDSWSDIPVGFLNIILLGLRNYWVLVIYFFGISGFGWFFLWELVKLGGFFCFR